MSDLEKREIQFSAVQDRGEALVLQHHPAAKTIEAYMSAMQSQWAWLLQLTLCLEVHLKHAAQSQQFFRDVQQAEQWISKRDESLNTIYSQSEFSLDEGERLLKGMQELREELNNYGDHVQKLVDQAKDVIPMKQRRQPVTRPMQVTCVCSYKQVNVSRTIIDCLVIRRSSVTLTCKLFSDVHRKGRTVHVIRQLWQDKMAREESRRYRVSCSRRLLCSSATGQGRY